MLRKAAAQTTQTDGDEYDINGSAGGNIDDAYSIGCDDGATNFAREILAEFFDA